MYFNAASSLVSIFLCLSLPSASTSPGPRGVKVCPVIGGVKLVDTGLKCGFSSKSISISNVSLSITDMTSLGQALVVSAPMEVFTLVNNGLTGDHIDALNTGINNEIAIAANPLEISSIVVNLFINYQTSLGVNGGVGKIFKLVPTLKVLNLDLTGTGNIPDADLAIIPAELKKSSIRSVALTQTSGKLYLYQALIGSTNTDGSRINYLFPEFPSCPNLLQRGAGQVFCTFPETTSKISSAYSLPGFSKMSSLQSDEFFETYHVLAQSKGLENVFVSPLSWGGNKNLSSIQMEAILTGSSVNPKIKQMLFSEFPNGISLARIVATVPDLTWLAMSYSSLTEADVGMAFKSYMRGSKLQVLELHNCGITVGALNTILQNLSFTSLQRISLRANNISPEKVTEISNTKYFNKYGGQIQIEL